MNHRLLASGTLAFLTTAFVLHPTYISGRQAATPQGGTLRGTVTRAGTSEPITDVQVSITNGRSGFGGQSLQETVNALTARGGTVSPAMQAAFDAERAAATAPIQLTTKSDRDGRFALRDLPAGQYTVRAEREGFFSLPGASGNTQAFAQSTVTVLPGQAPPDVLFSLTPGAAISGTAVDSDGHPVVAATVQVFRLNYQNGLPVLQTAGVAPGTTDDHGAYRLYRIPPGDYYLAVSPGGARGGGGFGGGPGARGASPAREGLVPTFYPNGVNAKDARLITLRGGEDMTGTAISVRTSALVTVSGNVVSTVPIPTRTGPRGNVIIQPISLQLVPHDKNALETTNTRTAGSANMESPANGQFQLTGVAPGSYDLFARIPNPNYSTAAATRNVMTEPGTYFGRTSFEVGYQDVQGLSLTIDPGVEIKTYVTVDGSASAAAGNVRIILASDDAARFLPVYASGPGQPVAAPDGSITIPFVNEGIYRLQVAINPGGGAARGAPGTASGPSFRDAYVEDIRADGLSVYDNGLQVGKQPPRQIEVIVKTNSGIVDGTVYDAQQQLKAGAIVVLAPPDSRRQNPALYKTATSDAMGHFVIRGMPPGQYKLFAWESVAPGAYQNPGFLSKYEERGRSVSVNPSSTTSAQVTVIATEK